MPLGDARSGRLGLPSTMFPIELVLMQLETFLKMFLLQIDSIVGREACHSNHVYILAGSRNYISV